MTTETDYNEATAEYARRESIFNTPRHQCQACGRVVVWGNVTTAWFHWDDGTDECRPDHFGDMADDARAWLDDQRNPDNDAPTPEGGF